MIGNAFAYKDADGPTHNTCILKGINGLSKSKDQDKRKLTENRRK